jgi:hypothetical protein
MQQSADAWYAVNTTPGAEYAVEHRAKRSGITVKQDVLQLDSLDLISFHNRQKAGQPL